MQINAKTLLLQALMEGEGFGLELLARVEERTGGRSRLSQGAVYPGLRELEREGLVESFEGETVPERLGRPRIYYRLTAEGRRMAMDDRQEARSLFGLSQWNPAPES